MTDVPSMISGELNDIWADDKLGRRKEAQILQRFLIAEAERGATAAVPKSYVLAIDAPYGQGKSWFLSKFREQVALKYPVAFVDAWADDTGNEPLVALMSAVDETLQPFFNRPEFKAKVAGVLASIGIVLPMEVGAILMSLSTIVVALNAQLLRRLDLRPEAVTGRRTAPRSVTSATASPLPARR